MNIYEDWTAGGKVTVKWEILEITRKNTDKEKVFRGKLVSLETYLVIYLVNVNKVMVGEDAVRKEIPKKQTEKIWESQGQHLNFRAEQFKEKETEGLE